MKLCKNCGAELSDDAKACSACGGSDFVSVAGQNAGGEPMKKMNTKFIIEVVATCVLCCAAIIPFVSIIPLIIVATMPKRYSSVFKFYDNFHGKTEEAAQYAVSKKRIADDYSARISKEADNVKAEALAQAEAELTEKKRLIRELKSELAVLQDQRSDVLADVVTPYVFDEKITSEEYKDKISALRITINDFVKSNKAVQSLATPTSKQVHNNNVKQLIRSFNSECNYIIDNATVANIDTCRNKLQKAYETLNKLYSTDNISLSLEYFELKLKELNYTYSYLQKKEMEKEEQKAIREQMLEEEKVRREIEREKARIEKEEHQFKNEISKLMKYLQKAADVEKQLYVDKIKELEDKLHLLEKDKENALQREQNTRAGYVYVISNIGSFGEDIYKIGMTRRLEPMDRIKELGDASVPFEFDVHAMIFSEDAPALENILHKTFAKNAVNLINPRKEFFRVHLKDVEKVVTENYNAAVTFTEIAKAEQYRESVRLAEAM